MAEQLALVKGYDFESDQGTVSLLSNTDGFEPAYGGWVPKTSIGRRDYVSQAITLRANGTSTDDVANNLQKLALKAEEAIRYYENGARDYAVWFRVQFSGETKGRQTLVRELRHEPASSVYDKALRSSFHWNKYTLGIDHYPWWEGTACGTITSGTVNTIGGTISFGTINGDLDARIAQIKVTNMGTHAIWPRGRVWIGVKSNRFGTVAGTFTPYWSFAGTCRDDIYRVTGGCTAVVDASAKGGTSAVWYYGSGGTAYNTEYFMYAVSLAAVTTKAETHRGNYRVLLRAKTNGSAQYLVRLKTDWLYDYTGLSTRANTSYPNAKTYPRVSIEKSGATEFAKYGDAWHYYELGDISIPPSSYFKNQGANDFYSLLLYAERISGTFALYMDGFVLIPKDGFVYAGNISDSRDSTGGTSLYVVQSPDGVLQSNIMEPIAIYGGTSNSWVSVNTPQAIGGMPIGTGGLVVIAADSLTQSLINTNMAVEIKYFERWKEVRGND